MIKLSFCTLGAPKLPLELFVKLVQASKYDGITLRGRPGEHVHWQDSPERRREVKKMCAEAGLEILALTTYLFLASRDSGGAAHPDTRNEEENTEDLRRWVDLATDLGAGNLRVFGGALAEGDKPKEALRRVARIMDAGAAVNPAVNICLETHDIWNTGKIVGKVLDATTRPNCKALWDIHGPVPAEEPVRTTLRKLRPERVAYLHVKDWFPRPGQEGRYNCLIGAGDVPFAAIIKALRRADWSGYFDIEWEGFYHSYMPPVEVAVVQAAMKMREFLGDQNA
jgi:sugar phosphate isomerase/epimerase